MIDWNDITNINLTLNMPPSRWKPSMREIKESVARRADIPLKMLDAASRKREYAQPRQIAMFLCRELTNCSYPQIGRSFGDRDHTTCLFAFRKVRKLEASDPNYAILLNDLRREINARVESRLAQRFALEAA